MCGEGPNGCWYAPKNIYFSYFLYKKETYKYKNKYKFYIFYLPWVVIGEWLIRAGPLPSDWLLDGRGGIWTFCWPIKNIYNLICIYSIKYNYIIKNIKIKNTQTNSRGHWARTCRSCRRRGWSHPLWIRCSRTSRSIRTIVTVLSR